MRSAVMSTAGRQLPDGNAQASSRRFHAQEVRTSAPKKQSKIKSRVCILCSPFPKCSCKSAEVSSVRMSGKTVAYENRTKSAQSGGLEKNGRGETNSGLGDRVAVRRFGREARGYRRFQRGKIQRRTLVSAGLAEEKGFELPVHFRRDMQPRSNRKAL